MDILDIWESNNGESGWSSKKSERTDGAKSRISGRGTVRVADNGAWLRLCRVQGQGQQLRWDCGDVIQWREGQLVTLQLICIARLSPRQRFYLRNYWQNLVVAGHWKWAPNCIAFLMSLTSQTNLTYRFSEQKDKQFALSRENIKLLILCTFLHSPYQPKNVLDKIQWNTNHKTQFITIKLLHFSAADCNVQGF